MAGALSIPFDVKAQSDAGLDSKPYEELLAELRGRMSALDSPDRKTSAFFAALGQPTRGGSLAESLSNGALTQAAAQREDDKLKSSYMQLIPQAIQASQQAQMQKAAMEEQRKRDAIWQQAMQPRLGMGAGLDPSMLPPENRISGQQMLPVGAPSGFRGMTVEQAMSLAARTGRKESDVLAAWKQANEGIAREPNKAYRMADGTYEMGPPTVGPGQSLQPNGQGGYSTSIVPGAEQATAKMKFAETAPATLLNSLSTVNMRPNADNTQSPVTLAAESGIDKNPAIMNLLGAGTRAGLNGSPQPAQPRASQQASPDRSSIIAQDWLSQQRYLGNAKLSGDKAAEARALEDLALVANEARAAGIDPRTLPTIERSAQGLQAPAPQTPLASPQGAKPITYGQSDSQKQAEVNVGMLNKGFIEKEYPDAVAKRDMATATIGQIGTMRQAIDNGLVTGWTTPVKATAAAMLASFGFKEAEKLASTAQTFNQAVQQKVYEGLNAASGTQTEGDAKRYTQTLANLGNTPAANQFQLDMAEAMARKDMARASFYDKYIPRAGAEAYKVAALWRDKQPKLWDDPILQKYKRD